MFGRFNGQNEIRARVVYGPPLLLPAYDHVHTFFILHATSFCRVHTGFNMSQQGTVTMQQQEATMMQQQGTTMLQQPGTAMMQQPGTTMMQQQGTTMMQPQGTAMMQQQGTTIMQQPGTLVYVRTAPTCKCIMDVYLLRKSRKDRYIARYLQV